jgi:hypothetical protein
MIPGFFQIDPEPDPSSITIGNEIDSDSMTENIISPMSLINTTAETSTQESTKENNQIAVSMLSELDMLALGGEMRSDVLATSEPMDDDSAPLWSADDFFKQSSEQAENGGISVSVMPNEIPNEIPEEIPPDAGVSVTLSDAITATGLEIETPGFQSLEFDSPGQDPPHQVTIIPQGLLNETHADPPPPQVTISPEGFINEIHANPPSVTITPQVLLTEPQQSIATPEGLLNEAPGNPPPQLLPISSGGLLNEQTRATQICRVIKLNTNDLQIRTLLDQGAIILADPSSGDGSALLVPHCAQANPQVIVQDTDAMIEVVNTHPT